MKKGWERLVEVRDVCKVGPPVGLNIPGVCIFCNLVCDHTDFLEIEKSCTVISGYLDFFFAKVYKMRHLKNQGKLVTNSSLNICQSGLLLSIDVFCLFVCLFVCCVS